MIRYKTVHKAVSIVGKEAYKDFRLTSKIRDPKKFDYFTDYRRITRKIWRKVAEDSMDYESGVYAKGFFYFIPQVIGNMPFIKLVNGKIKTNDHTNGDIYTPIFCNIFKNIEHRCWSIDGCTAVSYKTRLSKVIDKYVPKYHFILPLLLKNRI